MEVDGQAGAWADGRSCARLRRSQRFSRRGTQIDRRGSHSQRTTTAEAGKTPDAGLMG